MNGREAKRRRRMLVTEREEGGLQVLTSDGTTQHVDGDRLAQLWKGIDPSDVPEGEHFWAAFVMHRVDPVAFLAGEYHLDLETTVGIDGPGCYICEQVYTPELASRPCPGEPRR